MAQATKLEAKVTPDLPGRRWGLQCLLLGPKFALAVHVLAAYIHCPSTMAWNEAWKKEKKVSKPRGGKGRNGGKGRGGGSGGGGKGDSKGSRGDGDDHPSNAPWDYIDPNEYRVHPKDKSSIAYSWAKFLEHYDYDKKFAYSQWCDSNTSRPLHKDRDAGSNPRDVQEASGHKGSSRQDKPHHRPEPEPPAPRPPSGSSAARWSSSKVRGNKDKDKDFKGRIDVKKEVKEEPSPYSYSDDEPAASEPLECDPQNEVLQGGEYSLVTSLVSKHNATLTKVAAERKRLTHEVGLVTDFCDESSDRTTVPASIPMKCPLNCLAKYPLDPDKPEVRKLAKDADRAKSRISDDRTIMREPPTNLEDHAGNPIKLDTSGILFNVDWWELNRFGKGGHIHLSHIKGSDNMYLPHVMCMQHKCTGLMASHSQDGDANSKVPIRMALRSLMSNPQCPRCGLPFPLARNSWREAFPIRKLKANEYRSHEEDGEPATTANAASKVTIGAKEYPKAYVDYAQGMEVPPSIIGQFIDMILPTLEDGTVLQGLDAAIGEAEKGDAKTLEPPPDVATARQRVNRAKAEFQALCNISASMHNALIKGEQQCLEIADDIRTIKPIIEDAKTSLNTAIHHMSTLVDAQVELARDETRNGISEIAAGVEKYDAVEKDKLESLQKYAVELRARILEADEVNSKAWNAAETASAAQGSRKRGPDATAEDGQTEAKKAAVGEPTATEMDAETTISPAGKET